MFRISARTVLELGAELISSDIIAFYELIKNGFDAHTTTGVEIRFNIVLRRNSYLTLKKRAEESSDVVSLKDATRKALTGDAPESLLEKAKELIEEAKGISKYLRALDDVYGLSTITVSDTGSGMSTDELSSNFLVIGTASRKREVEKALARGDSRTPFLGEKGIGRLSAMRLGDRLRVETARKQDHAFNVLDINWMDFANLDAMIDDIKVEPKKGGAKPKPDWSGTKIIVGSLAEDWTELRVKRMAEYDFARLTDPFVDQKQRPRIVLFWNDERLSIPWMSRDLLDHAHARVSGTYEIKSGVPQLRCKLEALDLGFDHPNETEQVTVHEPDLKAALIGTTQSAHDDALVSVGPFRFEAHWYNRRRLGKIDSIGEMKVVRELQERWSGILLFRDRFRVFPYGDDEDDWLALDRKALRRSGYTLNKTQFIGRVEISRAANPALVDQTNREGLRVTPEQHVFLGIMQYVVQDQLYPFMKRVEKQYKEQKVDFGEAKSELSQLTGRARAALDKLRKLSSDHGKAAIEDLQQTLFEFNEFAEKARLRIEQVEQESQQMVEMAGVGLMVEVVAHELARASETAIENLDALRGKSVPEEVRKKLESLRAEMKSLSKRVRVLDPLSVAGRQRVEVFSLKELIDDTIEAHKSQFARHKIRVNLDLIDVRVRLVKGMVVQVLENLISNSKYWLEMKATRDSSFASFISIVLHDHPPTIIYEDNGPGIAPENRERVFQAFFSLKEKTKRRGLGLYIARECASYSGGTLTLDDRADAITGRLHRFTLELPEGASVR